MKPLARKPTLTFIQKVRSENTPARFGITLINVLMLAILAIFHYHTGTKEFQKARLILNEALQREDSEVFENLRLADRNCSLGELPLVLYTWPGTVPGCVCQQVPKQSKTRFIDYKFLDPSCTQKGVKCHEVFRIEMLGQKQLTKFIDGRTLCAKL